MKTNKKLLKEIWANIYKALKLGMDILKIKALEEITQGKIDTFDNIKMLNFWTLKVGKHKHVKRRIDWRRNEQKTYGRKMQKYQ